MTRTLHVRHCLSVVAYSSQQLHLMYLNSLQKPETERSRAGHAVLAMQYIISISAMMQPTSCGSHLGCVHTYNTQQDKKHTECHPSDPETSRCHHTSMPTSRPGYGTSSLLGSDNQEREGQRRILDQPAVPACNHVCAVPKTTHSNVVRHSPSNLVLLVTGLELSHKHLSNERLEYNESEPGVKVGSTVTWEHVTA